MTILIESWLALLCQSLPGIVRAVVLRTHGGKVISSWPQNAWDEQELQALVLHCSFRSETPSHVQVSEGLTQFSQPLSSNGLHFSTLFVECNVSEAQAQALAQLLTWSHIWLDLLAKQNKSRAQQSDHLLGVLEKASSLDSLAKNTYSFCSHLVAEFPLRQAIFCTYFRGKVDVLAVSKTPDYDSRTQPFEQLILYLESLHQGESERQRQREAYTQWLLRNNPEVGYEVYPLDSEGRVFGYLVVYFSHKEDSVVTRKNQIPLFLRYLSPIYFKAFWAELSLFRRVYERGSQFIADSAKSKRRIAFGAVTVFCLLVMLFPVSWKVKAEANIEGKVQRAIVVPEDGYLQEVSVTIGEQIKQGQLIASLDEKSIQLEVQRWRNEKQEHEREYNRELTALNHVQMRIAQSKIAQAQAKLDLYLNRLEKTRIVSPIDGIIIKGDLSRAVGAPVKQGQVLYEIAPNNQFKLVLLVDESDIALVSEGLLGSLKLSAFPSEDIAFQITAISSVFESSGRKLQYRVEAKLNDSTTGLRPGMTGIGKIIINRKPWVYVLVHPLLKKVQLWWWSFI